MIDYMCHLFGSLGLALEIGPPTWLSSGHSNGAMNVLVGSGVSRYNISFTTWKSGQVLIAFPLDHRGKCISKEVNAVAILKQIDIPELDWRSVLAMARYTCNDWGFFYSM